MIIWRVEGVCFIRWFMWTYFRIKPHLIRKEYISNFRMMMMMMMMLGTEKRMPVS